MTSATTITPANICDALYRILDSIKQLPSPPEVCLAVTQATQDQGTTLSDLESLVENDIALSGRLMQVANSAFFGVREQVTSTRRAISLLGFGTVRSLALGFFINEEFGKLQIPGLPYPDLPRFALASSTVAETIANHIGSDLALAADAACLGLLHESGVIVMAMAFGTQYRRMMATRDKEQTLADSEAKTFGVSHVLASKLLLKSWQLSDLFVEAAGHHHGDHLPSDVDPTIAPMWRTLRVASEMSLSFFETDPPCNPADVADKARMLLGWRPAQCAEVLSEAASLYEQRMVITGISAKLVGQDTRAALAFGERLAALDSTT